MDVRIRKPVSIPEKSSASSPAPKGIIKEEETIKGDGKNLIEEFNKRSKKNKSDKGGSDDDGEGKPPELTCAIASVLSS